ncbi:MAG: restriction endonuclease subunit S [Candidatus Woesearchaeota archaeon]
MVKNMKPQKPKFKQTEIGMIPEDWEVKELDSLGNIQTGKGTEILDKGIYKVIGSNGFLGYTNNEEFLEEGPLIFTGRVGTVGIVNLLNKREKYWLSDNTLYFKTENETLLKFIYYFLKNIDFSFLNVGSTQPLIKQSDFKKLPVALPPLPEQRAIAKILSDLDSKIELLQKMNKTLETIGQAIFKHWFVDFEFPNEEGKPYKSSGGEMVYNEELGKEIPKGWRVGRLGEIGKIQPGFAFKSKDFTNEGYGVVKIKNIEKSGLVNLDFESYLPENIFCKTNQKFHLHSGDVIIAMTGAELGKIGILPKMNKIMLLNQRVGKVVSDSKYFIYLFLKSEYCQSLMKGISSASSAQDNISNYDIENIKLIIPSKEILQKFSDYINPIFIKIIENLGQSLTLSQLRDSLLPKLMSGKIRVPAEMIKEMEKEIEKST